MCTLCAALNPFDLGAVNDQHVGQTVGARGNLPNYTLDQIADQLTDGYWIWSSQSGRSFDLGRDRTLTYDVSGLGATEQYLARSAMQAWADVSGLTFAEYDAPSLTQVTEQRDAAPSVATTARMAVNSRFAGSFSGSDDTDWVAVTLRAGQTYTFSLDSAEIGGIDDPYLVLRDGQGRYLEANDDANGSSNSQITFTATRSGTYFLDATAYEDDDRGAYDLTAVRGRPAHLVFDNDDSENVAYATSEVTGDTITSSFINVPDDWNADPVSLNSYWFQTYIHEVGHALGLGHGGNYNGDAKWSEDAHYRQDSVLFTIMSYFFQAGDDGADDANPNYLGDWGILATVMPADIVAIQSLYGSNVTTRAGNTTYGSNSNVGGYLGQLFGAMFEGDTPAQRVWLDTNMVFTVHDTGGRDTLNFSTVADQQRVSMVAGTLSSVGGYDLNMAISRGTVIENAIGGRSHDRIIGNEVDNWINGGLGKDTLRGGQGDDTLVGGSGADRLIGGAGQDMASYYSAEGGVTVNLAREAQATGMGRDHLSGVEGVIGGRYGDRLTGNVGDNILTGKGGNDRLTGATGDDSLRGGAGRDQLQGGAGDDGLHGGAGADTFRFFAGRDVVADFRDNVDTLAFDRALWGGARLSGAEILEFASLRAGRVEFVFDDGATLILRGVSSLSGLADDLLSY